MSFHVYPRRRDVLRLFWVALLENLGYRQLNMLWRLRGMFQWRIYRRTITTCQRLQC